MVGRQHRRFSRFAAEILAVWPLLTTKGPGGPGDETGPARTCLAPPACYSALSSTGVALNRAALRGVIRCRHGRATPFAGQYRTVQRPRPSF